MTQNLPARAAPKTNIQAGGQVAAIVPQTLDEAYRLSQALSVSGMAPRGIDKPEQIMVAIMAGAELGLAPFQSRQSFAGENGRPTLWGDGLIAVVRARGVRVKEWIEGEDDAMVAHCLATRPDTGEEIARAFTVADARKAGLWGKQGPWQQYPKRMLQMRARALALRDGCADMLRGIQVREEVEDFAPIRDVTPQRSGVMERLPGASAGAGFAASNMDQLEHPAGPEDIDAVLEGDVIPDFAADHIPPSDDATSPPGVVEGEREGAGAEPASVDSPPARTPSSTRAAAGDVTDREPAADGGDFDPLTWASEVNRRLETDEFSTVAAVDAFTAHSGNLTRFQMLEDASPGAAKALNAAINGRRTALVDKEAAS